MLNKFAKGIFFYLAYLPLFIILILLNLKIKWYSYIIITLLLLVIGLIMCDLLFKTIKEVSSRNANVKIIDCKNNETINFIITYIIPFSVSFVNINSIVAFIILFFIIAYLYVETELFCINPLLKIIFGYNIYIVTLSEKTYYLLSKKNKERRTENINFVFLHTNVMLEN